MCESGETGVEPWLVADWLPWLGASLSLAALEELVKKVLAAPNKIPDMPPIVTCFHELSFFAGCSFEVLWLLFGNVSSLSFCCWLRMVSSEFIRLIFFSINNVFSYRKQLTVFYNGIITVYSIVQQRNIHRFSCYPVNDVLHI